MELMDEQEMIRKAYFDATQASSLPPQWIYEFALNLLAAHSAGAQEPVAWMYQSEDPLDGGEWLLSDTKPNRRNVRPLYTHPQPITDAARDVTNTRLAVLEAAGNERDARLFRGLLSHCWDMRMHFDNRNMPKTVCATFKLSTKTGNAMMRDARKMIADFIENVAEIDRLDRAKGA